MSPALPGVLWDLSAKEEARKLENVALSPDCHGTVSKSPSLAEPQFSFLKNGDNERPTQRCLQILHTNL